MFVIIFRDVDSLAVAVALVMEAARPVLAAVTVHRCETHSTIEGHQEEHVPNLQAKATPRFLQYLLR